MTVGMLLATILLVLTFSGVLSGAWERLGIRQRTAGAWLLAMLAALLMPDLRLGAARVNPAGLAVTAAASVRLMMTIRPRRELVRVLLGSVIAGAMGLLVAQGAAGVSGVLRADVQPWTDAALLCASVSTALAEIVRRTAIFLLTPPGVKGGHRG